MYLIDYGNEVKMMRTVTQKIELSKQAQLKAVKKVTIRARKLVERAKKRGVYNLEEYNLLITIINSNYDLLLKAVERDSE